jgi:hypothetical protein
VSLQPRRKERYDVLKEPRIKLKQSASSVSLTGLEQRAVLSTEADCEFYSRREVLKRSRIMENSCRAKYTELSLLSSKFVTRPVSNQSTNQSAVF